MGNFITKVEQAQESNKHYQRYLKRKIKIKSKYDDNLTNARIKNYNKEEWAKYLKEIGDLITKPNGAFQKYVWDTLSTVERQNRERKQRPSKRSTL